MTNKERNSSVFGILCLIAAILGWGTPRLLLDFMYLAIFGFGLVGIIRDGHKAWSLAGLAIGGWLVWTHASTVVEEERVKNEIYFIKYEVTCRYCDVSYTNDTGGTSEREDIKGSFMQIEMLKGDEYISLSAQNGRSAEDVTVRIYINDVLVGSETSSGRYAIASASGVVSSLATGQIKTKKPGR